MRDVNNKWFYRMLFLAGFLLLVYTSDSKAARITPFNYGLMSAESDIGRFYALQRMHEDAFIGNFDIDYSGIDTISIEIPKDASSLRLNPNSKIEFGGVVFLVTNLTKDFTLFEMSNVITPFNTKWEQLRARVKDISDCIIVVEDTVPWVAERKGYGIGHIRTDILYVKNGKIRNEVISEYNKVNAEPKLYQCVVNEREKKIENFSVVRSTKDLYKTFVIRVANENNVILRNINITTPETTLNEDEAIKIANCTNVKLDNIEIHGTYSQENKWGYGVNLVNVWNIEITKMKADGNWGVFGNINVNTAKLIDCEINRFDIHCYGANIYFKNCIFKDLYNQFSSVYGKVVFEHCFFLSSIPLLIESSYNAYTPFDVEWKDCEFHLDKRHNCIMTLSELTEEINQRPELENKCIPNIYITNCKVFFEEKVKKWHFVQTGRVSYQKDVFYLKEIMIDGLEVSDLSIPFDIFSTKIETKQILRIDINNLRGVNGNRNWGLKGLNIGSKAKVYYDGILQNTEDYFGTMIENVAIGSVIFVLFASILYKFNQTKNES